MSHTAILADYAAVKDRNPGIRVRDAAHLLQVSEGELVAAHIGRTTVRLTDDVTAILRDLEPLGEVMALTRNDHCVHERKGVYANAEFSQHGPVKHGLFVNPDIDLRLFLNHWVHAFAVDDSTADAMKKSIQFFDITGTALHKVFLTPASDADAYDALVARHTHADQTPAMAVAPAPAKPADMPSDQIDWPAFRAAWDGLQDTHDFYPLLRRFKAGRVDALRHAGADRARPVALNAVQPVLQMVRDRACPIMVFVGNRGCIQIHTGPVETLKDFGPWANVLDPKFNLHVRLDAIDTAWVVTKPTVDGAVTALEMFAADGELIATLFGARKPGIPELTAWRDILSNIPTAEERIPEHA